MDNINRCGWVANAPEIYRRYHDEEWGTPSHDDYYLYKMLFLECFHAGLSFLIILKKRENFGTAFDSFDVTKIARYDDNKIAELMDNEGIVRSENKIRSAILNANIFIAIQKEFGTFAKYLWSFSNDEVVYNDGSEYSNKTELSDRVSNDLKKRGMKYVGSVTIYAYLQAVGIVNDHDTQCFKHIKIER